MTKKDYIKFADMLIKNYPLESEFSHFPDKKLAFGTALQMFNRIREDMKKVFYEDNYRFDGFTFDEYIATKQV